MNISILELNFNDNTRFFPAIYFYLKSYYVRYGKNNNKVNWIPFPLFDQVTTDDVEKFVLKNKITFLLCSVYTWNNNEIVEIIKELKQRLPYLKIVFGGPHVMTLYKKQDYFKENPFIDVACLGDGEPAITELLDNIIENKFDNHKKITGIAYKGDDQNSSYTPARCLHVYEISPYLDLKDEFLETSKLFDAVCKRNKLMKGIVVDSNRGCPYRCTFCDWGGSTMTKVLKRNPDKLMEELDLVLDQNFHDISLSDANFGLYPLDLDITKKVADYRIRTKFPTMLQVSFAKTNKVIDRLIDIHRMGHESGIMRFFFIHLQDTDPTVLDIIKRKNLSLKDFERIKDALDQDGVKTKTQFILGLPGQTKKSILNSAYSLLDLNLANNDTNLLIDLPGSEMASPVYRKKYQIESNTLSSDDYPIPSIRALEDNEHERLLQAQIPVFPPRYYQHQKYITNTFSFTKDEYSDMIVTNHMMTIFENNWFFKISRLYSQRNGISPKEFYEKVLSNLEKFPTIHTAYIIGQKQIVKWLSGEDDNFKIHQWEDPAFDELKFSINFPNYLMLRMLVYKQEFLTELSAFLQEILPTDVANDAIAMTDLMLVANGNVEKHKKSITVQGHTFERVVDDKTHVWQDHEENIRSLFLSSCYDQRMSLNVYQNYKYNGKDINLNQIPYYIEDFYLGSTRTSGHDGP